MYTSPYVLVPLALALLAPSPMATPILSGRLLDVETDAPVTGAELFLLDANDRIAVRGMSGDDGTFLLLAGKNGWFKLRAQRLGYGTTTSAPLDLVLFDSLDVEFRIAPEAIPLAPITVIGQQHDPERRDPRLERWDYYWRKDFYGKKSGFGTFLEEDDLRSTAFRVAVMLRQVSGLRFSSSGGRGSTATDRRGKPCRFYLNGMRTLDVDDLGVSSVVAVEVYPGMVAPGEYGGRGCVVAVWTGLRSKENGS